MGRLPWARKAMAESQGSDAARVPPGGGAVVSVTPTYKGVQKVFYKFIPGDIRCSVFDFGFVCLNRPEIFVPGDHHLQLFPATSFQKVCLFDPGHCFWGLLLSLCCLIYEL